MKTPILSITYLMLLTAVAAQGASPSSANYSVPADTLDGGGRRTVSVNYVNDASISAVAGVSTAVGPAEIAKHGFVGQLYDITGLALAANPTNVNETASRQLSAVALLDDATVLSLSPASITWSVVSGPIGSITPGGLANAGNVYQDTLATVRGAYGPQAGLLGLLVLNVGNDDFGAYASDSLPDSWQVQYFGLDNPNAAPSADPDQDGQNNVFEHIAGTVPTNALSLFVTKLELSAQPVVRPQITFSPRWTDRTYTVLSRDSLSSGSYAPLGNQQITDNGPVRTVTDLEPSPSNRFYRVQLTLP